MGTIKEGTIISRLPPVLSLSACLETKLIFIPCLFKNLGTIPLMGFTGLLFLFLLMSLLQLFHPQLVLVSGDYDLIQKTCRSTKYYDLCISSLKSDPNSPNADTKGLAMIMVGIGEANATAISSYLSSQLLGSANDSSMKKILKECVNRYTYSSDALQASLQALTMEAYDYAYVHVIAAADYPNACRNSFKRCPRLPYPPELGPREEGLKHLCDVVLGIIDLLDW